MIKIGITGGIGTGKTTVCKIFEALGVPVYYADDRAKKLMTADKKLKATIIDLLGDEAYHINGRLNRKYIASIAFADKKILSKLNKLVHPAVARDTDQWFLKQKSIMAIKEAALLIEAGAYKTCDVVIVVTCDLETRIARVMERDHASRAQVLAKIAKQMPEEEKLTYADYMIKNDGKQSLIKQVRAVYKKIEKR